MPLYIIRQDITKMRVDAIVNTTNQDMIGYSGVDLAVHTAGGAELDAECAELAPLGLGQAKLSGGHGLPCKYVIHTSGPVWQGGLQAESVILRSCYEESLKLAVENRCRTVAFPLISSGKYGYPKDQVLKFAVQIISEFLYRHELTVYLCVFDKESYTFSQALYDGIRSFIDGEDNDEASTQGPVRRYARDDAVKENAAKRVRPSAAPRIQCSNFVQCAPPPSEKRKSLEEYIQDMDKSFREMLFDLIDESGMTDVECYKRANVDKRTFSKIKSNPDYKPSKQTAIAFAISLRLDMDATQRLLATAGFTLSTSRVFDQIIRYFILNGIYDIFEINEALFEFDQVLLGC